MARADACGYDQTGDRCSDGGPGGMWLVGAHANGAATNRHTRSTARADRALSGLAARANVDERDGSRESHRARQVDEVEYEAERHTASGRSGEGRVRCEFRCPGPFPP